MMTRRAVLAAMTQLGMAGASSRLVPARSLFAQPAPATNWGKRGLIVRSVRPPDYETPVSLLDSFITPVEHFYVRSHLPIPTVDAAAYSLNVDGDVAKPLTLSLAELKTLPTVTVTTTLECAGNGRSFFAPPVAGVQWEKGAVGTARWTGVRMADLLERAGAKPSGRNVILSAADRPLGTMPPFVRQVPIAKATHPDTILAFSMNGQGLPIVHGFPVRAIVPGWEGAYSVKWVTGLTVIDREHDGFWVATAYRYPTVRVEPGAAVDPKDMAPLTGLAVKSLITRPADGALLKPGRIAVSGFAWAGERDVARVEVSTDDGATWKPARLAGEKTRYAWRRFEFEFAALRPGSGQALRPGSGQALRPSSGQALRPGSGQALRPGSGQALRPGSGQALRPGSGQALRPSSGQALRPGSGQAPNSSIYTIRSRATDTAGNVQPDGPAAWNPSGYLWNQCDAIRVAVGSAGSAPPSLAASHSPEKPPDGLDATVRRACVGCHQADMIEQQRLSKAGWMREVDKMIRWGAQVSDGDKSALVEYLAGRFGVR